MSSNETPGISGVPGLVPTGTRAPKAWLLMQRQALRRLPVELSDAQRARIRLRRLGGH